MYLRTRTDLGEQSFHSHVVNLIHAKRKPGTKVAEIEKRGKGQQTGSEPKSEQGWGRT